jgi:ATP-dependent helicase/nuclease subunit A
MSQAPTVRALAAAYFVNGQLVGKNDFYAIACHPQQHVVVEACAGAGKTWMLVSRILRALLEGAEPHEILAITFTKKAAAEMSQRLQEWLEDFSNPAKSDADLDKELLMRGIAPEQVSALRQPLRGLYAKVLQAEKPLQIRTFHSWFAQIARSSPTMLRSELGLPSSYELLDDDTHAIEAVWHLFWSRLLGDEALRTDYHALVTEHGRFSTQKALTQALKRRGEFAFADRAGVLERSVPHFSAYCKGFESLQEPEQRLHTEVSQAILWVAAKAMGSAKASGNLAKATKMETLCSQGEWLKAALVLLNADGSVPVREVVSGLIPEQADSVKAARQLGVDVLQAQLQHQAWLHQGRMSRLVRALCEDFSTLKRERGWVDMGDLETVAQRMLGDPALGAWLSQMLDQQVRHVLIDEFQDTNPIQWQVLHGWLQSYAGEAALAPRVFMVGDPKQSIYRFRGSDPRVFEAAKDFVCDALQGQWLACDHTRRNARVVVSAVNSVMQAACAVGRMSQYRAHSTESDVQGALLCLPKLAQDKSDKVPERVLWRNSLTEPRLQVQEHVRQLEARQVAQWLAAEVAKGCEPKSFLVLARKNERLARIQEELRALGVPSTRMDQDDLYQAPEVQDLVALLQALAEPHRSTCLARALKSPIFGLSDAQLLELAKLSQVAQTPWWQALPSSGLRGRDGRLIADMLAQYQAWLSSLPVHDALAMMLHDADVLASYAMSLPSALFARVQANVQALLGSALSLMGGRFLTVDAFIRALKNAQIKAPLVANDQAVQLLTVHKAKGLEADTVVLLDTDVAPAKKDSMGVLMQWPGEQPHPTHFVFFTQASNPAPSVVDAQQWESQANAREEMHALYVAMTRAKSRLVISATDSSKEAPNSWYAQIMATDVVQSIPISPETLPAALRTSPSTVQWLQLPSGPLSQVPVSAPVMADPSQRRPLPDSQAATQASQTDLANLGRGIHRLLQWAPMHNKRGAEHSKAWTVPHAAWAAIAKEFDLSAVQCEQAALAAQTMHSGQAAWLWDGEQVQWSGNEVDLGFDGQLLRLDRVVRLREPDAQGRLWWVVDYKLHPEPLTQPELCQQLRRYGQALQTQLQQPQATATTQSQTRVGMAFISANGRFWVLDT